MPASSLAFDLHFCSFTLSINLSPLILSETVALVEKISDLSRESEKETEIIIVCAQRKGFYDKLCRVRENLMPRR